MKTTIADANTFNKESRQKRFKDLEKLWENNPRKVVHNVIYKTDDTGLISVDMYHHNVMKNYFDNYPRLPKKVLGEKYVVINNNHTQSVYRGFIKRVKNWYGNTGNIEKLKSKLRADTIIVSYELNNEDLYQIKRL